MSNIIGLEILNEPNPPGARDGDLQSWYKSTINTLRALDPNMPLYISDSWRANVYADWISSSKISGPSQGLIVLDAHLYRCFTGVDAGKSASQHASELSDPNAPTPKQYRELSSRLGSSHSGLIAGEWSGALNPASLRDPPPSHNDQKRAFIEAELKLFEETCAGYFFWTYKKQDEGDNGWGWRDAVESSVFPGWVGLRIDSQKNPGGDEARRRASRDSKRDAALGDLSPFCFILSY